MNDLEKIRKIEEIDGVKVYHNELWGGAVGVYTTKYPNLMRTALGWQSSIKNSGGAMPFAFPMDYPDGYRVIVSEGILKYKEKFGEDPDYVLLSYRTTHDETSFTSLSIMISTEKTNYEKFGAYLAEANDLHAEIRNKQEQLGTHSYALTELEPMRKLNALLGEILNLIGVDSKS